MTSWLIDTSALARLATTPDGAAWAERIDRGLVRIATVSRLELGYSVRSGAELRSAGRHPPLASMSIEYQTPAIDDRAIEVQTMLGDLGRHRAPSVADLIVAATAELAGLTVLHLDKDFELIAELTGQPTTRIRTPST